MVISSYATKRGGQRMSPLSRKFSSSVGDCDIGAYFDSLTNSILSTSHSMCSAETQPRVQSPIYPMKRKRQQRIMIKKRRFQNKTIRKQLWLLLLWLLHQRDRLYQQKIELLCKKERSLGYRWRYLNHQTMYRRCLLLARCHFKDMSNWKRNYHQVTSFFVLWVRIVNQLPPLWIKSLLPWIGLNFDVCFVVCAITPTQS